MSNKQRTAAARRRTRTSSRAVLTAVVVLAALIGGRALAVAWSDPATRVAEARDHFRRAMPGELPGPVRGDHRAARRIAEGQVPDDVTVFADQYPAVANLDPQLLAALRKAATAAASDGVEVYVDSGWRDGSYQERLFSEAVSTYGSADEAARWVAPPGTSAHEAGAAVDLGPSDATSWLAEHGGEYGLCQIYENEPWHFELRADAVDRGCPSMYADATDDPRLQQ